MNSNIANFLASSAFGVAGASSDRNKFGNKVLRCYVQHDMKVFPVNPNEKKVEGMDCLDNVTDLPPEVESLSIITQPDITEKIVEDAVKKGIKNIWMQPGAESQKAIEYAEQNGVNVIAGGPCLLVVLGYDDKI